MGEIRTSSDENVVTQAADWFALLRSGTASDADRDAFEAWRIADPRHDEIYQHSLSVWSEVGQLDDLREIATAADFGKNNSSNFREERARQSIHRFLSPWQAASAAAVLFVIVGLSIIVFQSDWLDANQYATRTAETEQIVLSDGSVVDLAAESRLKVSYSETMRKVDLVYGEAFFDVRSDDPRAFFVASGEAEIRVVGTKFNVHQGPVGVTIAVAEGKVEVRKQSSAPSDSMSATAVSQRQISAGQQVVVAASDVGLAEVVEAEPLRMGAWRSGFLHYDDATLREVIADVNRYSRTQITLADDELNDLLLDTAFRTSQSQIDSMVDTLPDILPVVVDRTRRDRIVLRAARKE